MFKTKKTKLFIIFFLIVVLIVTVLITTKIEKKNDLIYVNQETYDYVLANHTLDLSTYNPKFSNYYVSKIDSGNNDYALFYEVSSGTMRLLADMGSATTHDGTLSCVLIDDQLFYINGDNIYRISLYEPYTVVNLPVNLADFSLGNIIGHDSKYLYCSAFRVGPLNEQQHINAYIAIKLDGSEWKEISEDDIP